MVARRVTALGFRVHVGWAAVVAVAEPRAEPEVVAKRRIAMADRFEVGAVYHACQGLPLAEAEARIRSSREGFERAAAAAIAALVAELRGAGLDSVAGAVVSGGARPLPPLEAILRSHALVHAAEGALYRAVVARASDACGVPALLVPARELETRAARALGIPLPRMASALVTLGRASGRPWARDQKEAALAAIVALPR